MVTPELIQYIRENLSHGISVQDTVQGLRDVGWTSEDIAAAFHEAQLTPAPPISPHYPSANSPATTTAQLTMSTNAQKPSHKRLLVGLVLSFLVVVLGAGGVYAYFVVLNPTPQAVLNSVAENAKNIHSLTATAKLTATIAVSGGNGANQFSTPPRLATTTTELTVTIDKTLPDTPKMSADISATANFNSMSFSGAGHIILIGDRFYFMIEKIPLLDMLLQGSAKNIMGSWVTYDQQEMVDFLKTMGVDKKSLEDTQAKIDQNPLKQSLSKKDLDELSVLAKKNPPLTATEQLTTDSIDGQPMFHYRLALNTSNTLDLYRFIFSKLDPSADTAAINTEMDSLKKHASDSTIDNMEIWIGKNDRFVHRLLVVSHNSSSPQSSEPTDTNTKVALTLDVSFKDYNKPSTITPPAGARSLVTDILGPSFKEHPPLPQATRPIRRNAISK
ncbi:MAG: hypothetical protein ACYC8S_03790 [Minisyncoccota bacterium]